MTQFVLDCLSVPSLVSWNVSRPRRASLVRVKHANCICCFPPYSLSFFLLVNATALSAVAWEHTVATNLSMQIPFTYTARPDVPTPLLANACRTSVR